MTKEEIINQLEVMRTNLHDKLSYVNAQHDILVSQLAEINNLLYRAKQEDPDDEE